LGRPDWIEVGRVVKPHGMRGEVRVSLSTDNPERFTPGARLFARPRGAAAGAGRPLVVEVVRGDPALPIVAFEGLGAREEAGELRDHVLEIPSSELPELPEGDFYPFQLEGLEARAPAGRRVGVVRELLEAPANDVLVVTMDEGGEVLLPFVMEAVPEVHLDGRYVVVDERFLPETGEPRA
jgi:16S rRNA processing protein RimM